MDFKSDSVYVSIIPTVDTHGWILDPPNEEYCPLSKLYIWESRWLVNVTEYICYGKILGVARLGCCKVI